MGALVRPMRIETAFEDPAAIRALVENSGPYPSIASYLPQSATGDASDGGAAPNETLPWFRGNLAVNGRVLVDGVEGILHNHRFAEAAADLFGAPVTPTTVVVNVNAPMSAGAVHVDIPSFRGAGRDRYPIQLLQAMGTSGLFERWRVVEAGAVCWFYDGPGGAYDYWPDGLTGQMCSERPPYYNVALVADNDRMYHRIGWIGDRAATSPTFASSSRIAHADGDGWTITDADQSLASYSDSQIRISILWKARVQHDVGTADTDDLLTANRIAELFAADLATRGIDMPTSADALSDEAWLALIHTTYYPPIHVDN